MVAQNLNSKHSTMVECVTWDAPSDTVPGVTYEVRAQSWDGEMRCNCPARAALCKHVRRAAAGELGLPRVRAHVEPKRPALRVVGEGFGFEGPREAA